jgi:hypothetical protein
MVIIRNVFVRWNFHVLNIVGVKEDACQRPQLKAAQVVDYWDKGDIKIGLHHNCPSSLKSISEEMWDLTGFLFYLFIM